MTSSQAPANWEQPDWHPDFGDAKAEFEHLRGLAEAVLSLIPETSVELVIPEPGLMHLQVMWPGGALAEAYSLVKPKGSDERRYALFLAPGTSQEQEFYASSVDDAAGILRKRPSGRFQMSKSPIRLHGQLRGLDKVPSSPHFEGRFGRLFRALPPARFSEDTLRALASHMVAEHETDVTPENEDDDEEAVGLPGDSRIPAGFTYLGQFIDHDLTFDPASSLQKQNDPDALIDFRTPRFDLDNVYGRGPDDQPYLYQADGVRMRLGRKLTGNPNDPAARDVPRTSPDDGEPLRALIGDPRNDENVIVCQLQAAFLRFHNRLADVLHATDPVHFPAVQRLVRWHYQWIVLNDFLPTIIGRQTLEAILPHVAKGTTILDDAPQLKFYSWQKDPFLPVEFTVAAYRFGHSMVRPIYRLNRNVPPAGQERPFIFSSDENKSLVGFRKFPDNWAIEWNLFFEMGPAPDKGPQRVQPAYKIDSSLVNPLGSLPASVATGVSSLAERNLFRGLRMGLPSGQAVARKMGLPVIPDEKLKVGKANQDGAKTNIRLVDISAEFRGNAPLWYYVLAEAQQGFDGDNAKPMRLGPVGGRIVGEVFAGLMLGDRHSFLVQDPSWQPMPEFTRNGKFGMAELIAQAMQA
jgi:hypothetical protein